MKRFLVPALVVLIVGLVIAWFFWNKPHRKAEDESGLAVTSETLYAEYAANEAAANTRYLNKVLAVTGELTSQEKNQDGQTVAVLRGAPGDDMLAGGVMCTLREKDVALPAGATITLKGFCNGFANDVHLSDCVLNNNK